MNKKQYLDALKNGLKWLPDPDRQEALSDYEAHFDAGISLGKSEEEIAANLGDPAETIRMYHTQSRLATAQETVARAQHSRSAASVLNAILAGIGLGFLNLIIIVPVFFALAAVVIALYAVAASITVSGIAVMLAGVFFPVIQLGSLGLTAAIYFFTGAGLICLGILACIGCWYLSKYFGIGMMRYIEFNINIVRGRSQKRAMKSRSATVEYTVADRPGVSGGEAGRTSLGNWLRRTGDALDTAAEKTAQGARTIGRRVAGGWRKCQGWWQQFFSKEKEDIK